jgi:hypothetical protein
MICECDLVSHTRPSLVLSLYHCLMCKPHIGLHSGPVTAGVLRGERARFQLFGDTVNTAARMESTGERNRIQLSDTTAALMKEAGKGEWIRPREGAVTVKGKGEMRTHWLKAMDGYSENSRPLHRWGTSEDSLNVSTRGLNMPKSTDSVLKLTKSKSLPVRRMPMKRHSMVWGRSPDLDNLDEMPTLKRHASSKTTRLVDWNVELLAGLLKQVVAQRRITHPHGPTNGNTPAPWNALPKSTISPMATTALDEVVEVITLPNFDPATAGVVAQHMQAATMELDHAVMLQLCDYVEAISAMYRDNPFHNFEHACHVQMSMNKLLQRVVTPEEISYEGKSAEVASQAHAYTYGITSDPLTQFAVVFCALVHDVDHAGVPNSQLIKEKAHVATVYKNKSVAEQNSVDLAWDLLMDPRYQDLRQCLCTTTEEFQRFRQLLVNVVLATDIFDQELSALRKNRWNKAFHEASTTSSDQGNRSSMAQGPAGNNICTEEESPSVRANRKATIVLEHLIQASDVAHTMQHWDIYTKWNGRLFREMYQAYQSGRTTQDPSENWYQGELGFFDHYIIPLAKKLKECEVFGVCSDECLNYALENRSMWEANGEQIVEKMLASDMKTELRREQSRSSRRSMRSLFLDD